MDDHYSTEHGGLIPTQNYRKLSVKCILQDGFFSSSSTTDFFWFHYSKTFKGEHAYNYDIVYIPLKKGTLKYLRNCKL